MTVRALSCGPSRFPGLGPRQRRAATRLFDLQCWYWGQDIHHPEGNALLRAGFLQDRPSTRGIGSTAYRREERPGQRLVLWGFGMFFGCDQRGGVWVRRHGFEPRITQAAHVPCEVWRPEDVPIRVERPVSPVDVAMMASLVSDLLTAVAAYERWAIDTLGIGFREACFEARPRVMRRKCPIPILDLPSRWEALRDEYARPSPY